MTAFLAILLAVSGPDDGFPTGTRTAEGAAADMARAFMSLDSKLFRATCVKAGSHGENQKKYAEFLDRVAKKMDRDKDTPEKPKDIPRRITKIFKARGLSKNGPASAGYALYNFQNVRFVDVVSELNDGKTFLCRTLVVQLEDKTWRAVPRPDLFPLISMGLNNESKSTEELKPK